MDGQESAFFFANKVTAFCTCSFFFPSNNLRPFSALRFCRMQMKHICFWQTAKVPVVISVGRGSLKIWVCPKCIRSQLFHDSNRKLTYYPLTIHFPLLQKSLLSDRMECKPILIVFFSSSSSLNSLCSKRLVGFIGQKCKNPLNYSLKQSAM